MSYEEIYTARYRGEEVSKFDWQQIGDVIAKLAMVALRWYVATQGGSNGDLARHQKQLSRVIDPDDESETIRQAQAKD